MSRTILCGLTALLVLGFSPISHSGQVYKCLDGSGKTTYQSQPCPETARSVELDIRGASSMPLLTGNVTVAEAKQAILANCMGNAARQANAALKKIAAEHPRKFQSFCECVADNSLADVAKIKELIAKNDRAGFEQIGMKAGLSCAPRLQ